MYTVLRLVPTFPMIGTTGTFSASDLVAPLFGLMLGPYVGGASVILGTFLAVALGRGLIFLGLDFLPATVAAVSMGLLVKRRFFHVTLVYLAILILFLANPLTLLFVKLPNGTLAPYSWLHFVGLILLLSPLTRKAVNWVSASSLTNLTWGVSVLCLIGTMIQHLTGNLLFESVLGLLLGVIKTEAWPALWTFSFYIYPIERAFITLIATLVGSMSLKALKAWHKWPLF